MFNGYVKFGKGFYGEEMERWFLLQKLGEKLLTAILLFSTRGRRGKQSLQCKFLQNYEC